MPVLYRWIGLLALFVGVVSDAAQVRTWQTLTDYVIIEIKSNDGDSFHVRWNGTEFIFRIYFADCPEADARFPDRVAAQAVYFGITPEQAIAVGKEATMFTRRFLEQPFSVKTRWQNALGSSRLHRNYGFVQVHGRGLAELLVSNGLARIHGVGVSGLTASEVERLRTLEAQAKAKKRGAWGLSSTVISGSVTSDS